MEANAETAIYIVRESESALGFVEELLELVAATDNLRVVDGDWHDADCVVVTERDLEGVRSTLGRENVPLVLYGDVPPFDDPHVDAFVNASPDDPLDTRVAQLRWVIHAVTTASEREKKITRLHAVTDDLLACTSEQAVYERAVEAAEKILDIDMCGIDVVQDDWLIPAAVSDAMSKTGYERVPVDEGIAGRTLTEGRSFVVDDVPSNADAKPVDEQYRSGLSVPIGDIGVFQAGATEPGWFDDRDLELVELLMRHVENTVNRLRIVEALREREAELIMERDRLSLLFENVPNPVVEFEFVNGGPVAKDANTAFESVFGYEADVIVGEHIDDVIVPPDRRNHAENLNDTLAAGDVVDAEARRMTANGLRDFLVHVAPIRHEDDRLEGYAIYTDITEHKRRERQLERQNERLESFAGVVSHDLRNPLAVAKGYLDLAVETGDVDQLSTAVDALERMDRLIEELLTLAKEGREVGARETVSLEAVARRAWGNVDTKDASLVVADPGTVEADEQRVLAVFENVFRNAIEHGSPECTITVGRYDDGFYVEDDGPGIPVDVRDDVFDTGFTTREGGTGFGLAIVKGIVDAHGWTIEVGETENGGARFEIETAWTPTLLEG